jgi:hypothetical protein
VRFDRANNPYSYSRELETILVSSFWFNEVITKYEVNIVSLLSASSCIVFARGDPMRKKYTFLLTILPTEDEQEELCGRLQLVQSNRADTFTNLEELRTLINQVLLSNPNDTDELLNTDPFSPSISSPSNGNGLG